MLLPSLIAMFVGLPLLELIVLLKVHAHFGLGNTVALVFLTGVIGAFLARAQGLMVVLQIRHDMAEGRMPAPRLIDGVMILVAGVLLITPGLITDTVGFLLLCPPVRAALRLWMRRKLEESLRKGQATVIWVDEEH